MATVMVFSNFLQHLLEWSHDSWLSHDPPVCKEGWAINRGAETVLCLTPQAIASLSRVWEPCTHPLSDWLASGILVRPKLFSWLLLSWSRCQNYLLFAPSLLESNSCSTLPSLASVWMWCPQIPLISCPHRKHREWSFCFRISQKFIVGCAGCCHILPMFFLGLILLLEGVLPADSSELCPPIGVALWKQAILHMVTVIYPRSRIPYIQWLVEVKVQGPGPLFLSLDRY